MSGVNISRFHWNAHVITRLRATTRPVWECDPVMTVAEVDEARRCHAQGWHADTFVEMLIARDEHLKMVG